MATDKSPLTVIHAPTAVNELHDIWRWNAQQYGVVHADKYLGFLTDAIAKLASMHERGRAVPSRPDLRYIIVRRRAKGHGHVAVYNYDDRELHLLHVFHTAQNWQAQLAEESG